VNLKQFSSASLAALCVYAGAITCGRRDMYTQTTRDPSAPVQIMTENVNLYEFARAGVAIPDPKERKNPEAFRPVLVDGSLKTLVSGLLEGGGYHGVVLGESHAFPVSPLVDRIVADNPSIKTVFTEGVTTAMQPMLEAFQNHGDIKRLERDLKSVGWKIFSEKEELAFIASMRARGVRVVGLESPSGTRSDNLADALERREAECENIVRNNAPSDGKFLIITGATHTRRFSAHLPNPQTGKSDHSEGGIDSRLGLPAIDIIPTNESNILELERRSANYVVNIENGNIYQMVRPSASVGALNLPQPVAPTNPVRSTVIPQNRL
jgi:hypothetical protein